MIPNIYSAYLSLYKEDEMIDTERGTGRTTKQMIGAPIGAIFISCHASAADYDRRLAHKINRDDLRIVEPSWLDRGWHGKILTGIVIDHATNLTEQQRDSLEGALTRVR